jgi:hypothetical protein
MAVDGDVVKPAGDLPAAVDALHAEVRRAGEDVAKIRALLDGAPPDDNVLASLLRRAVPLRFLEYLGVTPPWCERALVAAQVVLHPKTPRALSLRLVSTLYWRHLAEVAATPHVPAAVRVRAEANLKDLLRELRLGEKITLARLATWPVIRELLLETEPKVLESLLENPRLREEDLLLCLRRSEVSLALVHAVAASSRWSERYAVKLELALQPKTPLPVALLQISSLVKRDLRRVAEAAELPPLLQMAAQRVADGDRTPRDSET